MGEQVGDEPGIYNGELPELSIHHTRIALGKGPGVLEITENGSEKRLGLTREHDRDLRGIEELLRTGLRSGVDRFGPDESLGNLKLWFDEHGEGDEEIASALDGVRDHIDHVAFRTARERVREYGKLIHELDGTVLAVTHADSPDIYGITSEGGHLNVARLRGLLLEEESDIIHAQPVVERTVNDLGVIRRVGGVVCLIETTSIE
jgi:hypothetical protein